MRRGGGGGVARAGADGRAQLRSGRGRGRPAGGSLRPGAPGTRRRRPRRGGRGAAALRPAWSAGSHTMALAEVVVCAVGRVVTLPAVEITAQATALLVLVTLSAAEDNGRGSPLCSGARGRPGKAETVSSPHPRGGCGPWRRPLRLPEPAGERSLRDRSGRGAAEDAVSQLSASDGFKSCGGFSSSVVGFSFSGCTAEWAKHNRGRSSQRWNSKLLRLNGFCLFFFPPDLGYCMSATFKSLKM